MLGTRTNEPFLTDLSIDVTEESGKTPLHFACAGGHRDIVNFLIQKGADVEKGDAQGNTPLELLPVKSVLAYLPTY